MTYPALNHGDEVMIEHRFRSELAEKYAATANPDPDYLAKLQRDAAYWREQYNAYIRHIRVTNTSYHLAER